MKMDRNLNADGHGKYALINLRTNEVVWGGKHNNDFFVIMLKDRHSKPALLAYANSIEPTDPEFAKEVRELASQAGVDNPYCKEPD